MEIPKRKCAHIWTEYIMEGPCFIPRCGDCGRYEEEFAKFVESLKDNAPETP